MALPTRAPASVWPQCPWSWQEPSPSQGHLSPGVQPPMILTRCSGSAPHLGAMFQGSGGGKHRSPGTPQGRGSPQPVVSWSLMGGPGPAKDTLPTSSVFLSHGPVATWLFRPSLSTYDVPSPYPCQGEVNVEPLGVLGGHIHFCPAWEPQQRYGPQQAHQQVWGRGSKLHSSGA